MHLMYTKVFIEIKILLLYTQWDIEIFKKIEMEKKSGKFNVKNYPAILKYCQQKK